MANTVINLDTATDAQKEKVAAEYNDGWEYAEEGVGSGLSAELLLRYSTDNGGYWDRGYIESLEHSVRIAA